MWWRTRCQVVQPDNLIIVVSPGEGEIQAHLGGSYRYVVQEERRGTGHAVLQLQSHLRGYRGRSADPVRRHAAVPARVDPRAAEPAPAAASEPDPATRRRDCIVDRTLPYGRVIRDAGGRIIDIIEEAEASAEVRQIRELNVGAYVVRAEAIFPALARLAPAPDGDLRLTDCVHQLIRSGLGVESYQIYDQDEIQGINTAEDLERPSSSCKSGSSGRGGRRKRTSSRSAPAAGGRSSARGSRSTMCGGWRRRWPTRSPAGATRSAAC